MGEHGKAAARIFSKRLKIDEDNDNLKESLGSILHHESDELVSPIKIPLADEENSADTESREEKHSNEDEIKNNQETLKENTETEINSVSEESSDDDSQQDNSNKVLNTGESSVTIQTSDISSFNPNLFDSQEESKEDKESQKTQEHLESDETVIIQEQDSSDTMVSNGLNEQEDRNENAKGDKLMEENEKLKKINSAETEENGKLKKQDDIDINLEGDEDDGEMLVLNFSTPAVPEEIHEEILNKEIIKKVDSGEINLGDEEVHKAKGVEIAPDDEKKESDFEFTGFDDTDSEGELKLNFENKDEDFELEPSSVKGIMPDEYKEEEDLNKEQDVSETVESRKNDFGFTDDTEEEKEIVISKPVLVEEEENIQEDEEDSKEESAAAIEGVAQVIENYDSESYEQENSFRRRLSEAEDMVADLAIQYTEIQEMSNDMHEFLVNNIQLITKERIVICLEDGDISLEEYKDFLTKSVKDDEMKRLLYKKARDIEMQYLFENFINCFDIESITRRKLSVDDRIIKNIVKINENVILIDVYYDTSKTKQNELYEGEVAFLLSHDITLDLNNHLEDIITAKLNVDRTYMAVLSGTVVDDETIKMADKYGIKILKIDMQLSTINKHLEDIMSRIIK